MLNFLKENFLYFVIFLTGAAVLIIEVVATRILAPYFGTTIFVVSSVMGIILAALSVGYYVGGKIADKTATLARFFKIILGGGLAVLFLSVLVNYFLPIVGPYFSIINGPPILTVFLFFLPIFFLGMLSPFTIALQSKLFPKKGVGTISGKAYFWSTLGSIMGSFSSGFLLIPFFGVQQIVISTGVFLILLGGIPLFFILKKKLVLAGTIIVATLLISLAVISTGEAKFLKIFNLGDKGADTDIIYRDDGVYSKISIVDSKKNGRSIRYLLLDRNKSASQFKDNGESGFEYLKYSNFYKLSPGEPEEILFIGGGAYIGPALYVKKLPKATVDVCEIEPSLFELSKKYFDIPDSNRLKNHVKDGRLFLSNSSKKYDLIFGDAYDGLSSIPAHLTTKEFFKLTRKKLNKDGVVILNVIGQLEEKERSFLLSEIKTFKEVFESSYFLATRGKDKKENQNVIFVGFKDDTINPSYEKMKEKLELKDLSSKLVNPENFNLSDYPTLTDNYSPVDYLVGRSLLE